MGVPLSCLVLAGCVGPRIVETGETDGTETGGETENPPPGTSIGTTPGTTVSTTLPPQECFDDSDCPPRYSCFDGQCYYDYDYCDGYYGECCYYDYYDCCYYDCYYDYCYSNEDCYFGEACIYEYCTSLTEVDLCAGGSLELLPVVGADGAQAISLAFADLNGDAAQDLILGSDAGVDVLLGPGSASATNYAAGGIVSAVAGADFDGDTNDDVVASSESGFSVLLGDGTGVLTPGPMSSVTPAAPIFAGDFNADGNQDLVGGVANSTAFYAGDGAGLLAAPAEVGDAHDSFAVGEIDGNQAADVVVRPPDDGQVYFGADGFPSVSAFDLDSEGWYWDQREFAIGDFDNDGFGDIAGLAPIPGGSAVHIWQGDGTTQFTEAYNPVFVPGDYARRITGDVDGDGLDDLVLVGDTITVVFGAANSALLGCQVIAAAPAGVTDVAVGDLDGDGAAEIAIAFSGGVFIYGYSAE